MPADLPGPHRYVPMKEGATELAVERERLRYWEAYTASELVGLRCSSYAENGLAARQRNFDLGMLRLADIVANEHVVERSMPLVRRHPKDSLFACLLLEGEAFFFQSGTCTMVQRGDLIIYNTVKPYLYGFTRPMRQLMIDIKAEELFEATGSMAPSSLLKIEGNLRSGKLLTEPLREQILGFIGSPLADEAPALADEICTRLRMLLRSSAQDRSKAEEVNALRLLRAERYIASRLADPRLDAEEVAQHLAMSVRNLNRIFEVHACSVTQWIWHERITLAHRQLADPKQARRSVGDVALGCGFSTQSHFAREFRQRYGLTPTQHRAGAIPAGRSAAAR